jgi:transcriptional regulator with XRE-family HTH domain
MVMQHHGEAGICARPHVLATFLIPCASVAPNPWAIVIARRGPLISAGRNSQAADAFLFSAESRSSRHVVRLTEGKAGVPVMGRSPLPSPPYATRSYRRAGDGGTRCTTLAVTRTSPNRRHGMAVAVGELGPTLRAWRDRLAPEDWGLPAGTRRRAPGLRRQEVARLAGVSVDYIVQLEQGRAAEPSEQVLSALARALRLSDAERAHMYSLAGRSAPSEGKPTVVLPASVRRLVDQLWASPTAVYDPRWNPIAWNPLWTLVMGDPQDRNHRDRNLVRRQFMGMPTRVLRSPSQQEAYENSLVADLRRSAGRFPHDQELAALVGELSAASDRFRELWESRNVDLYDTESKEIQHPTLGVLNFDCDILTVQRSDVRVVVYTAPAGGETAAKLPLRSVPGHQ